MWGSGDINIVKNVFLGNLFTHEFSTGPENEYLKRNVL